MNASVRLLVWIAVAGALPGCLWADARSQATGGFGATALVRDTGHATGMTANMNVQMAGLGLGLELGAKRIPIADPPPDDTRTFIDLNAALVLRAAPLAILATDHALERWFDFGFEAGVGGGAVAWSTDKWSGEASGFVGGYLELGTVELPRRSNDGKDDRNYLALVGTIRTIGHDEIWDHEVVFGIGLAMRMRGPIGTMPHD